MARIRRGAPAPRVPASRRRRVWTPAVRRCWRGVGPLPAPAPKGQLELGVRAELVADKRKREHVLLEPSPERRAAWALVDGVAEQIVEMMTPSWFRAYSIW